MDRVDVIVSDRNRSNSSGSSDGEKRKEKNDHEDNVDGCQGSKNGERGVNFNPTSMLYDMSGDKLMYIFNHYKFQDSPEFSCPQETREGTEHDVSRLQKTFGDIGFKVDKPCDDYTTDEIRKKLKDICDMDHKNTSCIAIVILTHGDGGGIVYAADMPYALSIVINRVLHAKSLAGKPKLFFIQACRGGNSDSGHRVSITDGQTAAFTIPTHSDYFVLRSSFEDHVSFRSSKGSWMIQTLCDVVDKRQGQNILEIATIINNKVAQITSCSDKPKYHKKKQIPEMWFTLTKFLDVYNKN